MFELALALIGMLGFGYIGYRDLKTTEFPDWVPYAMVAATLLVKVAASFAAGDPSILTSSLINGLLLFGIGYIMYLVGSWADGDAYALGALGFLFPLKISFLSPAYFFPLPLVLISNVFVIGGVYMIAYALVLGVKNARVMRHFRNDLRKNAGKLVAAITLAAVFAFGSFLFFVKSFGINAYESLLPIPMGFVAYAVFMLILWRYVKVIDQKIFVRRIPASRLGYGDIPVASKLLCMPDPALIRKLRAKGGYVKIKEGVRFTPVFLAAFLFALIYGDIIYLILSPL